MGVKFGKCVSLIYGEISSFMARLLGAPSRLLVACLDILARGKPSRCVKMLPATFQGAQVHFQVSRPVSGLITYLTILLSYKIDQLQIEIDQLRVNIDYLCVKIKILS